MKTRCPGCLTLYRIDAQSLVKAKGQVRCARCRAIFDAHEHAETFEATSLEAPSAEQRIDDSAETTDRSDDIFQSEAQIKAAFDHALSDITPDVRAAAESDSTTDNDDDDPYTEFFEGFDPFDEPSQEPPATKAPKTPPCEPDRALPLTTASAANTDSAISKGQLPDVDRPKSQAALLSKRNNKLIMWAEIGVLALLALALISQFILFYQTDLENSDSGRTLLAIPCQIADCELTERRAPKAFRVRQRHFNPIENSDSIFRLMIAFSNDADFAQPYPLLQLTLSDSNAVELGRSTLTPETYLHRSVLPEEQIPPNGIVKVELFLTDPGTAAQGFSIDFL